MKKGILILGFFLLTFILTTYAATLNWSFSNSSNYSYNAEKIELSGGLASLKTDFFNAAWSYRKTITIDNSSNSNTLSEYQVEIDLDSSKSNFWSNVNADGSDVRFMAADKTTLIDFYQDYFDYNSQTAKYWVKVPTIEASTTTTIYLYYGNSAASSVSSIEATFSYSAPKVVGYLVNDRLAGTTINVVSMHDDNQVFVDSFSQALDAQETADFSSASFSPGTSLKAKNLFQADSNLIGTDMIVPVSWAGREFHYQSYRLGTKTFCMVAPFGTASGQIYKDGALVWSGSITAEGTVYVSSASENANFRISSDLPILVSYYAYAFDSIPFYPATTEDLYGVPSQYLVVGTGNRAATINISKSDGTSSNTIATKNSYYLTSSNGGRGDAPAHKISTDQSLCVNQQGDNNGSESTTFLPRKEMGTLFSSAQNTYYITIAAPQAGTVCSLYDENGVLQAQETTGSGQDVYHVLFTETDYSGSYLTAGWRLETSKPVYAYYERYFGGRETNLFSYKQMRQYTYPHPVVSIEASYDLPFASNNPSIESVVTLDYTSLDSFTETATKDGGEITYQLSNDGGSTWYYWNFAHGRWELSNQTYSQSTSAETINANFSIFPQGQQKKLAFRAFFHSSGTEEVVLDQISFKSFPLGGYTQDNLIPSVLCTQESNQSGVLNFSFRAREAGLNPCTLYDFQYSTNEGFTWLAPTSGDSTEALPVGWSDNSGQKYDAAVDWTGPVYTLSFNTKHSDVAGFNNNNLTGVKFRFWLNDGYDNSLAPVSTESFVVDNLAPQVSSTVEVVDQPLAGLSFVTLEAGFSEANPQRAVFQVAINNGSYGSFARQETSSATPSLTVAVGSVLNGDDFISSARATLYDQGGYSATNEASLATYVKPYQPLKPTVFDPQSSSIKVMINKHLDEATNLEYAIYEVSQGQYVQANGTLGSNAFWQTIANWGTVEVAGLTPPTTSYSFKTKSRNISDLSNLASSESQLSATGNASTVAPMAGYTEPNIIPGSLVSQEADGSGRVVVYFRVKDLDLNLCSLYDFQYSTNEGSSWLSPVNGDTSEALVSGWNNNSGSYYQAAADWAGSLESFSFYSQHSDLNGFSNKDLSTVQVRFRVNDGTFNSSQAATVTSFAVDNLPAEVVVPINLTAQPTAGSKVVSLNTSFTSSGQDTTYYYLAVNDGLLQGGVSGEGTQEVIVAQVFDGNDYISLARAWNFDEFGNLATSETTSLEVGYKYVKPYQPAPPTIFDLTSSSLKITVNKNTAEVSGLEYQVYELSQEKFVQLNGTLDSSEVWATREAWGNLTLTGLSGQVSDYTFRVKSRNSSDSQNQRSSESDWSLAAGGSIAIVTPEVVFYNPTAEAINVSTEAKISLAFSRDMDLTSVENAFSLKAIYDNQNSSVEASLSGSFSWSGNRLVTFEPTVALSKGYTYQVNLRATAQDYGGYPLASNQSWAFRTIIDNSQQNIFVSQDGKAKVQLGLGALSQEGWVEINRDPINNATEVDANAILTANNKAIAQGNPFHYPLTTSITEFNAYNSLGQRVTQNFSAPVTITLYYDDVDSDGFVDNTNPPINEAALLIYWLDETNNLWVRVPGSTVNPSLNYVTAQVNHFSVYTLMSTPALDLDQAYAFPVPFRPSLGHSQITFTNLASQCTIRVFTLSGNQVVALQETDGDGQYSWDATNADGAALASGVYFYHIQSTNDNKTGKLMIIR